MVNKKEKTYWPHMIVGFIMMGVTLGYWTIKSASLMPVQESNNLMQKYQMVDININDILIKREAFDRKFKIDLTEVKRIVVTDNIYSKRVQENPVELMVGENSFNFIINSKNNSNIEILNNAKISFLLTRPHTRVDDILIKDIKYTDMNVKIKNIDIKKAGRYVIQLRVDYKGSIGYFETPAYLKVKEV